MNKKRRNANERAFTELADRKGWEWTKRGWPDFLCEDYEGLFAVEVKPRRADGQLGLLRREQADTLDWLSSLGVRCFVSDGEVLEEYDRETHASESRRREFWWEGSLVEVEE